MLFELASRMTAIKKVAVDNFVLEASDIDLNMHKKMAIYLVYFLVVFVFNIQYPFKIYYKFFQLAWYGSYSYA